MQLLTLLHFFFVDHLSKKEQKKDEEQKQDESFIPDGTSFKQAMFQLFMDQDIGQNGKMPRQKKSRARLKKQSVLSFVQCDLIHQLANVYQKKSKSLFASDTLIKECDTIFDQAIGILEKTQSVERKKVAPDVLMVLHAAVVLLAYFRKTLLSAQFSHGQKKNNTVRLLHQRLDRVLFDLSECLIAIVNELPNKKINTIGALVFVGSKIGTAIKTKVKIKKSAIPGKEREFLPSFIFEVLKKSLTKLQKVRQENKAGPNPFAAIALEMIEKDDNKVCDTLSNFVAAVAPKVIATIVRDLTQPGQGRRTQNAGIFTTFLRLLRAFFKDKDCNTFDVLCAVYRAQDTLNETDEKDHGENNKDEKTSPIQFTKYRQKLKDRLCNKSTIEAHIKQQYRQYRQQILGGYDSDNHVISKQDFQCFYARMKLKTDATVWNNVPSVLQDPSSLEQLFKLKKFCLEVEQQVYEQRCQWWCQKLSEETCAGVLLLSERIDQYYQDHLNEESAAQWQVILQRWIDDEITETLAAGLEVKKQKEEIPGFFSHPARSLLRLVLAVASSTTDMMQSSWQEFVTLLGDIKDVLGIDMTLDTDFERDYIMPFKPSSSCCFVLLSAFLQGMVGKEKQAYAGVSDYFKQHQSQRDETESSVMLGLRRWVTLIKTQWDDPTTLWAQLMKPQANVVNALLRQVSAVLPPIEQHDEVGTCTSFTAQKMLISLLEVCLSNQGFKDPVNVKKYAGNVEGPFTVLKTLFIGGVSLRFLSQKIKPEMQVQWGKLKLGTLVLPNGSQYVKTGLRLLKNGVLALSGCLTFGQWTSEGPLKFLLGKCKAIVDPFFDQSLAIQLLQFYWHSKQIDTWLTAYRNVAAYYFNNTTNQNSEKVVRMKRFFACKISLSMALLQIDTLSEFQFQLIKSYIQVFDYLLKRDKATVNDEETMNLVGLVLPDVWQVGYKLVSQDVQASWCADVLNQPVVDQKTERLSFAKLKTVSVQKFEQLGHNNKDSEALVHALMQTERPFFSPRLLPVGGQSMLPVSPPSSPLQVSDQQDTSTSVSLPSSPLQVNQQDTSTSVSPPSPLAGINNQHHSFLSKRLLHNLLLTFLTEGVLFGFGLWVLFYYQLLSAVMSTVVLASVTGVIFLTGLVGGCYLFKGLSAQEAGASAQGPLDGEQYQGSASSLQSISLQRTMPPQCVNKKTGITTQGTITYVVKPDDSGHGLD